MSGAELLSLRCVGPLGFDVLERLAEEVGFEVTAGNAGAELAELALDARTWMYVSEVRRNEEWRIEVIASPGHRPDQVVVGGIRLRVESLLRQMAITVSEG